MSDLLLRRLERSAQQGDAQATARLLLAKVRAGQLPFEHIVWGAHLGDPIALGIVPEPRIVIDCPNCQHRRDERTRRNRNPRPTPIRETPRQCLKCRGSENTVLEKGLIKFVQQVSDVSHRLLAAWAADCVEHQLDNLIPKPMPSGLRYRLPTTPQPRQHEIPAMVLPAVRRWLCENFVDPVLYQLATGNGSVTSDFGVRSCLCLIVVRCDMPGEERMVRYRAAEIASTCYHAAGGTRAERTWQETRLIQYLLGY